MKTRHVRLALPVALLLASCAVQPATNAPTSTTNDPLGLGDAVAARYQALSANATPVAIANVAASSTGTEVANFTASASSVWNEKWFAVTNLTDGNLHSAWEPAAPIMDSAPSLTLNLAQATQVTGLGIKMDAGATFDVSVNNGGTWTTIATNVSPQYHALDFVSLPASTAQQVKLVFHVKPDAKLLVCEVKVFQGGNGGNPSPVPSVVPSIVPSPMPSVVPSSAPSTAHCVILNIGGASEVQDAEGRFITLPNGTLVDINGQISGSIDIQGTSGHPETITVTSVQASGNTLVLKGSGSFGTDDTLTLTKLGQSGDTFRFYLSHLLALREGSVLEDVEFTKPGDADQFFGSGAVIDHDSAHGESYLSVSGGGALHLRGELSGGDNFNFSVTKTDAGVSGTFWYLNTLQSIPPTSKGPDVFNIQSVTRTNDRVTLTGATADGSERFTASGAAGTASGSLFFNGGTIDTLTITDSQGNVLHAYTPQNAESFSGASGAFGICD